MTKIYPNSPSLAAPVTSTSAPGDTSGEPTVLTVWRKSLLFNCSGFTVFDSKGNLVFRVDNYAAGSRSEAVLMDASGEPLFTVRRKRLRLGGDHWLVYDGEEARNPRLSVKKQAQFLLNQSSKSSKTLARIAPCSGGAGEGFCVEGSYCGRSCTVYDAASRQLVAEITKKEAAGGVGLGNDVFRLVVQPALDAPLAMAVVLALEQIFGSRDR